MVVSFGLDQSTTYENSHKMKTPEVMLWLKPNDNLVKISNDVKVIECGKKFIWPRPGARNGSQQQKNSSGRYIDYRGQIFFAKLIILPQQDAIGGKQGHQQELLLRKNKIQRQQQQQQQQQSLPLWGRSVLKREAFTKERSYFPQFLGGVLWTLTPVASRTQLSRPISLGHHTSWNARRRWTTYKVLVTKPTGVEHRVCRT